jgi:Flp pilus assembly protein TadG
VRNGIPALRHRLRLRRRRRDERGSLTLFTILWAFLVMLLAALAIDGGLAISQRERAADLADQAARAEAQDLQLGNLRGSGTPVIAQDGCRLARAYVAGAASSVHWGTANVVGDYSDDGCDYSTVLVPGQGGGMVTSSSVTVEVQLTYTPFVFNLFAGPVTVTETGTAFAQAGD